ncbi:tetratricopeptide repeat protein, partial [Scytonema sp. PRP1]|uniref:tetratricopeptide repeat protein n=1 Tax=Scytonema sp. PRP1 TaxID=3120513 RepID=UPI002FD28B6B
MSFDDDLNAIFDHFINNQATEADKQTLRQLIGARDGKNALQIGKNIVNIAEGRDIQIGDRIYQGADAEAIKELLRVVLQENQTQKPINCPKYIPYSGVRQFVGREKELTNLHQELQQPRTVAISAVAGMGGVGKTELAIKYAKEHQADYPGGICWLNAITENLEAEIVQFASLNMNLKVRQKLNEKPLSLTEQVAWCWQNWQPPEGLVLVVFDDVTDLKSIRSCLPRNNNRFRVLITTRLRRLDSNFVEIFLDVLSPEEALQQLAAVLGKEDRRIQKEPQTAKDLCKWLGYLPLGLELVGRYLAEDPDLSLAKMLQALQKKRLQNRAINPSAEELQSTEMTAKLGVKAAFDLSWQKLDTMTKRVGELLSLFAPDAIPWELVESASQKMNWADDDVNEAKKQLYQYNLIQRLDDSVASYKIHPLIREFLQEQLAENPTPQAERAEKLKQSFVATILPIAKEIPQSPTLEQINLFRLIVPHLAEVAENLLDAVKDEDLIWVFVGMGRFYQGQGLYALAEPWCEQCVSVTKVRLGDEHPNVASSINNLAALYDSQGRYSEAEPLYIQALELTRRLLGSEHPNVATSINNLAGLYHSQGRYSEAEPLYIQALELRRRLLGSEHPDVAWSINNLALLYD